MGVIQDIYAALSGTLNTVAGTLTLPVHWEGTHWTPDTEQPYLDPTIVLTDPDQAACGEDAQNKHSGFLQVLVCYPLGTSYGLPVSAADTIISAFKRGTKIATTNFNITISSAGTNQAIPDEGWYKLPVRIFFYAYTPN